MEVTVPAWREKTSGAEPWGPAMFQAWKERGPAVMCSLGGGRKAKEACGSQKVREKVF